MNISVRPPSMRKSQPVPTSRFGSSAPYQERNGWQRYAAGRLSLMLVLAMGATFSAHSQTFTVLHTFTGEGAGDGAGPVAPLIVGNGSLYGTTEGGGRHNDGVLFRVHANGTETFYSFKDEPDGATPYGGLVQDGQGNGYGTTEAGGTDGLGTVFKVDAHGIETVLHNFGAGLDGRNPTATLAIDGAGNLFGTTYFGGAHDDGTVFKIDVGGNESVLYSFAGYPADGSNPFSGVIVDGAGSLYGTTEYGGTGNVGAVFKVDASGNEVVLSSFTGLPGGAFPSGGLVMDEKGNLYGTTVGGGRGYGIVFKLTTAGEQIVVHTFSGSPDGGYPYAGLIRDAEGNLYGTTEYGGSQFGNGYGTVFEISKGGEETVLYTFTNTSDGELPVAALVRDGKGNLYGTASQGGKLQNGIEGYGTVFLLTP